MPILELQRRLREIGRIRIGQQVPYKKSNGAESTRPVKLETFRLTSRDRRIIEAAASLYGGQVAAWDDQWEVVTDTAELTIMVPPGGVALTQWYEQWSAGGCQRRCDGKWETVGDQACLCDPEARDCGIHTRLSVVVSDLPGLGVWRLDTGGWYAATELVQIIELLSMAAEAGRFLPARLRLEQREVKRLVKGRAQTFKFAVPTVDLDARLLEVPALVSGAVTAGELGHPTAGALAAGPAAAEIAGPAALPSGMTPVPPATTPGPSARDQIASVDQGRERQQRSPRIPSPGVEPRTAADAADPPAEEAPPARADDDEGGPMLSQDRFLAMHAKDCGLSDEERKWIVIGLTAGRTASGKDLSAKEVAAAREAMDQVKAGTHVLDLADGRWTVVEKTDGNRAVTDAERADVTREIEALDEDARTRLRAQVVGQVPAYAGRWFNHRHYLLVMDALEGVTEPTPGEPEHAAVEPESEPEAAGPGPEPDGDVTDGELDWMSSP